MGDPCEKNEKQDNNGQSVDDRGEGSQIIDHRRSKWYWFIAKESAGFDRCRRGQWVMCKAFIVSTNVIIPSDGQKIGFERVLISSNGQSNENET